MTDYLVDENNLIEIVQNFNKNEDKKEFISSFDKWIKSFYKNLKQQGKTDCEIEQEVCKLCFTAGRIFSESSQFEKLKYVIGSALLEYIIQYKYSTKNVDKALGLRA